MNIDILAAPQFHNCRIDAPRGIHNSGGMSVLIDSIRACLMDRYAIRLCHDFFRTLSTVCFAETCFFTSDINDTENNGDTVDLYLKQCGVAGLGD